MALVERLMHLDPDPARQMAVHTFFAAVNEVGQGFLTSAQVQTYYAMTAEDLVDWNAVAALMPGAAAAKALFIERIHGVFILAEVRAPGYDTPAAVRTKLGI